LAFLKSDGRGESIPRRFSNQHSLTARVGETPAAVLCFGFVADDFEAHPSQDVVITHNIS
jgi:hypothetical protein